MMDSVPRNKGNILIVSTDKRVKDRIHQKLHAQGYQCSEGESTSNALGCQSEEEIDVILVDNDLPHEDTLQLLTEIRTSGKNVAVIVVTDVDGAADAVKLLDLGAYDYIIKPFWINEIAYNVQRAVEKRRLERELQIQRRLFATEVAGEAKRSYENFYRTMAALSFALEGKDSYTAGHSRRVCDLALAIGGRLGIGENDLEDLRWGSLLHDLGKIAVDQNIMNKPGELTAEEYASVMAHPIIGATIVASVVKNINIAEIIAYHHLNYNTDDTNQKLKGPDIPLLARIITLADAYDAMTSDRPYRVALSHDQAVAEIKREAGIKFDPDIVKVFLQISPWKITSEKRTILVVDDEEGIRLIIRSILGNEHNILEATNGQDALEIAQRQHPSLVLMDIIMPHKSGFDACHELKNNPATKDIPVIMLTEHEEEINNRLRAKMGADDYVIKPFNIMGLLEKVKRYLNQDGVTFSKIPDSSLKY